jgi:acetylornithine/succinyldiaminopimelate/putrescine aminotransferase
MKEIPEKSAIIEAIMQHELITKVSGKGLMYCITMNDQFPVGNLISTLEDRGIITDYFLFAGNAFRITPPLSITTDELRTGLNTIIQTINDIRA